MLTDADVARVAVLVAKHDEAAWELGDLLSTMKISKSDMVKLADTVGFKARTLRLYMTVAIETPKSERRDGYSHSIYRIFARIDDPTIRWNLMFAREEWTIEGATRAVQDHIKGPAARLQTAKMMVVGETIVKAKFDDAGNLTVKVWLGSDYDAEVMESNAKFTTIKFTAG